ncbi:MAG: FHA domain-containing protein [Phycisphaerales bacterium]|nr:FHA domain-containing protein [Phycisphaerales bacterium]
MLVLTVIQGPDKGKKYELPDHEPQLIGRSSEALPISDTTVSRRHAELTPDDGVWWIRDLRSQNGTYLNGVRLADRQRLRPGDQIRVGATLFVFGATESRDPEVVRLMKPEDLDASIERAIPSNEDSVILAEPEPRAAAVHHLKVIYQLTTLTAQALDKNKLLRSVIDIVFDEFKPERGTILLSIADGPRPFEPVVVKYATPPRDVQDATIHVSRTILQHAVKQGEGVLSSNAMNDPRFAAGDSVQRFHIRSAICSPIRFREHTFGAIYIDSSIANYTFTPEQLALMNAIGQHTGLALANADLYAEKLQTERLAAIGETVASLSHSIKNIVQGLRGGADVVEMGLRKDDLKIAKGGWSILKRNLDRIMSLALNMLAYSRQRRVELDLVRLGPLLEECAQLLEGQCQAKGAALILDVDPEMPPIPIDAGLIHQALMNLMTNAVEAVDQDTGAVTVRALYHSHSRRGSDRAGPWVEITVTDNGPGIPEANLARIFEPFNTTKGLRGTGLGLAVAKRVVEEHGGDITAETGAPPQSRGATFRIILPADPSAAIDPSATAAERRAENRDR